MQKAKRHLVLLKIYSNYKFYSSVKLLNITKLEKRILKKRAEKDRREHGLPVNDNTMVELANLCGYLGLDFNKYFDGYELPKESKFFTGNY